MQNSGHLSADRWRTHSARTNSKSRSTSRVANKQHSRNNSRILSADHIQKTHKEDTDYTSSELTSESEGENNGKINKQKYSNQMQEHSDYSAKDDKVPDKPAMQTLKKTFTSMLSKLPFTANHRETSLVSENGSVKV